MTKKNTSLPDGYDKVKSSKPYLNLGKLSEGEHRFRIVQKPIAGWLDWKNNQPLRFRPDNKPASAVDPARPVKSFWVMHVWNYERKGLFVMEVTQAGIKNSLEELALSEEWGDLTSFDFKIKKEGTGMESRYVLTPIPHKPLSQEIKEAVANVKIDLSALYEGKDPWTGKHAKERVNESTGELVVQENDGCLTTEQTDQLNAALERINEDDLEDICNLLGIISIYEIDPRDFDRVIRIVSKKAYKKEEKESA